MDGSIDILTDLIEIGNMGYIDQYIEVGALPPSHFQQQIRTARQMRRARSPCCANKFSAAVTVATVSYCVVCCLGNCNFMHRSALPFQNTVLSPPVRFLRFDPAFTYYL